MHSLLAQPFIVWLCGVVKTHDEEEGIDSEGIGLAGALSKVHGQAAGTLTTFQALACNHEEPVDFLAIASSVL
jgi:hypothetical protein